MLKGSVPVNFFKWGGWGVGGSFGPFKGSPRHRASSGPLAHMFSRLLCPRGESGNSRKKGPKKLRRA